MIMHLHGHPELNSSMGLINDKFWVYGRIAHLPSRRRARHLGQHTRFRWVQTWIVGIETEAQPSATCNPLALDLRRGCSQQWFQGLQLSGLTCQRCTPSLLPLKQS